MAAEVYYRKWRPRSFAELAGQEAVVRTLTNAALAGKFSHAYLFSGPRGTGKTTAGRLLAKMVNCTSRRDGEACNECDSCTAFLDSRALDLIELDAASNRGIDEIRSLREKANFAPAGGADAFKVYLVDEVHMLTEPAFNALLKTLEEPPAHVIFVLATTEAHKVPATVVSRCQRFDFRRIPVSAIVDRLSYIASQEGLVFEPEALELLARMATGSLRDAANLMEQAVDSYGKQVTFAQVQETLGLVIDPRSSDLALCAVRSELAAGLDVISAVRDDGLDLRQFQRQVVQQLRELLLAKAGAGDIGGDAHLRDERTRAVEDVATTRLVAALRAFGEADLRSDPLSPLPLELALASTIIGAPAPVAVEAPVKPQPGRGRDTAPRPPQAAADRPSRQSSVPRPAPARPAGPPEAVSAPADGPGMAVDRAATSNGDLTAKTQPEAIAPPVGDVAAARERWQDVYQRARELHYKAGALLNSGCGILSLSDNEIVFGFRHQMLLDRMLGDAESTQALQRAVDEVLGPGRVVRCILDATVEVQRPARGGHLVRAAEELGGQVLSNE